MKKLSRRPVLSRGLLGALLVLLATPMGTGCSEPSTSPPPVSQGAQTSEARFRINIDEDSGVQKQGRVSAQAFRAQDVIRIVVDVYEQGQSQTPLFINFELTRTPDTTQWSGTLPFLPRGKMLTFFARAFGAESSTLPLFSGSTDQQLEADFSDVIIRLAPSNDGAEITLPRIKRISIPSVFTSGQAGNISFLVEANTGEHLTYSISGSTGSGSGTFFPVNGAITLLATSGTFVSQYVPGTVTTESEFVHTVKVTNEAGHSVTTTFRTRVKPAGTTTGVGNTDVLVLFNPVINGVDGSRLVGTGNVTFTATVADDGPAEALTYAWGFAPAEPYTPVPAFTAQTNPTTLQHYTTSVRGLLTLAVTDGNGGTTTLEYALTPDQFPDDPAVDGPLTGINAIRAGENHTCALFNNGTLRCWGRSHLGQLGYGNTLPVGTTASNLPYSVGDVALLSPATRLATGGNHTCALLDTGLVRCWGNNQYGQLGFSSTEHLGDGEPIASFGYVNLGGNAVKLAAGLEHTCALMDTQKVRCWGRNQYGQLGYGNTQNIGDNEQPWRAGDVDVGAPVQDVVAGGYHTCAMLTDGAVRCWGYGATGQLGYGSTVNIGDNENPSTVGNVNVGGPVRQLSGGLNHTCALLDTGRVRCWGYNLNGQLGYGSTGTVLLPASAGDVNLGTPATRALQVVAGGAHTCALLDTGAIKCWGYGLDGRLGYGNTTTLSAPSASTVNLDGATAYQLSAGGAHTCALLSTGKARCWGNGGNGQLGIGSAVDIGDNELPTADVALLPPTP
ncbi:RCC1 domain-containing protein [Pyxidicoccus trucidator]|uniref:RCC1 domain-containing protein n=1 Tax=Pyxidicoccus trucidator TaxID=2709662 RepID=UPI0013DB7953|nr:RTX toxin [Pyxidicoccus trucidator]